MKTHAFKDAADPTKGVVRRLWHSNLHLGVEQLHTNVLEVRCGPRGKSRDLSSIDLSTVALRQRIPELALQMAALIAQGT